MSTSDASSRCCQSESNSRADSSQGYCWIARAVQCTEVPIENTAKIKSTDIIGCVDVRITERLFDMDVVACAFSIGRVMVSWGKQSTRQAADMACML